MLLFILTIMTKLDKDRNTKIAMHRNNCMKYTLDIKL
jgi:hypothetical protein